MALPITGVLLGWAMLIDGNAAASPVPPNAQSVTIASKWISGGKSHTHYFRFTSAPVPGFTDFQVDLGLYAKLAPGDRVCLVIHTGLLGWRWYGVQGPDACGDPFWGKPG